MTLLHLAIKAVAPEVVGVHLCDVRQVRLNEVVKEMAHTVRHIRQHLEESTKGRAHVGVKMSRLYLHSRAPVFGTG